MEPENQMLCIGGCKGHVTETIDGNLLKLYRRYRWKMIPGCTGRYTCRDHQAVCYKTPMELLRDANIMQTPPCTTSLNSDSDFSSSNNNNGWRQYEWSTPQHTLIVPLDSQYLTGLITYIQVEEPGKDSENESLKQTNTPLYRFVHTLNSASGFRRKLEAMGVKVSNEDGSIHLPYCTHPSLITYSW